MNQKYSIQKTSLKAGYKTIYVAIGAFILEGSNLLFKRFDLPLTGEESMYVEKVLTYFCTLGVPFLLASFVNWLKHKNLGKQNAKD